jgi:tetratricopeptide (TPR) repeat protein
MSATANDPNAQATPATPARWQIAFAAAAVVVLAFLLASVPARNSDVWRRLATGRALLAGTYTLGTDPFAYTIDGATWTNHAWLYDLLLYASQRVLGAHLVFFNTLLAAALAALMLLAAGVARRPWLAAFVVALALVALGPFLVLAPAAVSYMLFAFTLWWLDRTDRAATPDWSLRAHWPLFLALILWANCDEWFLLGPAAVGLFWVGSAVRNASDGNGRPRAMLFLVSIAVCVLNGHHLRAFGVPAVLRGSTPEGAATPMRDFLAVAWPDIPVPLAAYGLLAVVGLLSTAAGRLPIGSPRTLVFFAFLALSLYRSAAIPFFAIAAGPFLAERLGESLALPSTMPRRYARLIPVGAVVALLTLVVLACPGWLQGPFEPRGWHLHADPSLKQLAERIALRHRDGELGAQSRGFCVSVDLAHYLEWHCPEEKVFLDGRTDLFPPEVVSDFQQVGKALFAESPDQPAWIEAREVLRRWQVSHLLVADPVDRRLYAGLRNLWQLSHGWSLVELQGRAAVFAGLSRRGGFSSAVDWEERAFDPARASTAPRDGIRRHPQPRPWWDCFDWEEPAGGLDRDEAVVDVIHFEAMRPAYFGRSRLIWEAEVYATQLTVLAPHASPVNAIAIAVQRNAVELQRGDEGPPGSLLLAVRAARRALHANPDDALAHLALGRAYERLLHHTSERGIAPQFPLLDRMRKVQAIVALKRAVELRPNLLSAHELLVALYLDANELDLALPHVEAHHRLSKAAGPRPNESQEEFSARIGRLADHERQLGKQVRERLNLVDTKSFNFGVYRKATLAMSNGLPGYALELLLRSNDAEFGREGAILQLHLLLHTGRTRDFGMMIDPRHEATIGKFNYHWSLALLAAADGAYDQADEHLRSVVVKTVDLPHLELRNISPGQALTLLFAERLMSRELPEGEAAFLGALENIASVARKDADLHTLRGLLALECGSIDPGRKAFDDALNAWNGPVGSAVLARHCLRLMTRK